MTPYTGNGFYCYSDSLHMVLQAAEMRDLPSPGFLECLTTMPFGHTYLSLPDGPLPFFSGPDIDPDKGVTLATQFLGWDCAERFGGTADEALARLRQATQTGPALVGPLDMGYLSYNPNCRNLKGTDHYVVVLGVDQTNIHLHDPAGFPVAVLPHKEFLLAWQAEQVHYKRGPYTFRWNFRPKAPVDRREMISLALDRVRNALAVNPDGPVVYGGPEALLRLARDLRDQLSPRLAVHLTWFALPLGARRAVDAAQFILEAGNQSAGVLMGDQACLFGEAQYHAVNGHWGSVRQIVERLAVLEERFVQAL